MNVDWDGIAKEADGAVIQSVRSFAASAEELNVKADGLSCFVGVVMGLDGDYQSRRMGNRFATLGMLEVALTAIRTEMLKVWIEAEGDD